MTGTGPARLPVVIASGLGCGFARYAPGTVGSLAALLPGSLLLIHPGLLAAATIAAIAAGLWAIPRASGGADHGWIVIDEIAGQWITLLGIPTLGQKAALGMAAELGWIAAAFAVFRLLDISKPGPIGAIDRRHDALGVMGDDILAGLCGAALLLAARFLIAHGTTFT